MKNQGILFPRLCLVVLCAWTAAAAAQDLSDIPLYMTAELVASDPARRVVVVRDSKGAQQTYLMDDLLAGTPGLKPGDRVILTLRGGSGVQRVSAIARVTGSGSAVVIAKSPSPGKPSLAELAARREAGVAPVKEAFARQVAALSQDAKPVDAMWAAFSKDCGVQPFEQNDGRAWFGLWDGRVLADYTAGPCRDVFNQMVAAGEVIKKGMAAAEEAARKDLTPGEIREIRRLHLMEWDGWSLAPPPRREP